MFACYRDDSKLFRGELNETIFPADVVAVACYKHSGFFIVIRVEV